MKPKGEDVKTYVWKQIRGGNTYSLQVEAKNGVRIVNKINKLATENDWRACGTSVGGKKAVLLFVREFESETELKAWAKKFPYEVLYEGLNGKERRIG